MTPSDAVIGFAALVVWVIVVLTNRHHIRNDEWHDS